MKNILSKLGFLIPSRDFLKQYGSYLFVGSLVFLIGLVWHFPMDGIINQVLTEVEKQSGLQIAADEFAFSLPVGIKAKNVSISSIPVAALAQTGVQLESFAVHISPLSLITYPLKKSARINLSGQQKAMSFNGQAIIKQNVVRLKGNAKNLAMNHDLYIPNAGSNLSIEGLLSLQFNLLSNIEALQKNDLSSIEGTLKTVLKKAVLTPPLMSPLNFDQISLDGEAEKSKAIIKALKIDGPMLSGILNGYIDLRPVLDRSIADLEAKVQIGKDGQALKPMLQIANIRLDASGKGAFKITGPLNNWVLKSF